MKLNYVLPFIILSISFPVMAKLNVIGDFGGESAIRFYEPIQPVHTDNAPQHPNAIPSEINEEQLLPVVSHKLSPGKVETQVFNLPGASPLFLIDADESSKNWLQDHYQQLATLSAMGIVVNVETQQELQALRELAPGLMIMPAPADSLAERLGIYHYPFLLTAEGITQ
ncbi:integrating conjugative element protein [Avibacterium sp. 21-599]|uniref:integrating conjugative element protein n=1 Tax=Avibacterium sp. 21-599 TaxID=2911528 RepID=UPI0022457E1A|nr:integrating conjugative element protein [Avibacterium sp. 21-599]MCW9718556.1 integrating conjugative element protein [Avibacterium sp. 21-599]